MPANVMLLTVLLIVIVGVSYFLIEDKREEKASLTDK